jgi:hypothetical protein
MPARLHHIVIDAHDQPGLAGFWTQALGWKVLSETAGGPGIIVVTGRAREAEGMSA